MNLWTKAGIAMLCWTALAVMTLPGMAHELWVEAPASAKIGQPINAQLCFGYFNKKAGTAGMANRLIALRAEPGGPAEPVELSKEAESFASKFTPQKAGYHAIGGELEIGILDNDLHGIPAQTRLKMVGKSLVHVEGSDGGLATSLGTDLELIPVGRWQNLRPGQLVTVKAQFKGKPIGGRKVSVSLKTLGSVPLVADERIDGLLWTVEAHPDPRTGEVSFPVIVPGEHLFQIRYTDETPGRYEGDREITTRISHLRKGDTYLGTLHIATLTLDVKR